MFGDELKSRRLAARMSLDALASASGRSKTYIANLENNKPHPVTGALPNPTRDTVERLAIALDWSVNAAMALAGFTGIVEQEETPLIEEMKEYLLKMDRRQQERALRIIRELAAA